MKKIVQIIFYSLCILWWCSNTETPMDWSFVDETLIERYSKNAIVISELERSVIASWLSFNLLPIDGFKISPSPIDENNTVTDFLFIDYNTKEIGIHFFDFMPNEQNIMRKYSLDSIGVPYENIYPPLKDLDITNENRAKFPEYYYIPDVPDYTQSYKKEYLQNSIWKEYIPFYYQPMIEADFDTFILWTGRMYASDKNQVYILLRYDIPVLDHNKFNYEVFRRNGIIQYPFYNIIPGADPKEGNQIDHPFYLVQSGGVWYKGVKLEEADPSAEILYYGSEYFVQDEWVWFEYIKIPEASPKTFKIIKDYPQNGYALDEKYLYNNITKETKENIKQNRSYYRCIYKEIFQQIKDNPVYYNNALVELMRETNNMEWVYEDKRCVLLS